jgi:hypothetical protein
MHETLGLILEPKKKAESGMVFICNLSTQKAEAGHSQIQGQPGLHDETLSQPLSP